MNDLRIISFLPAATEMVSALGLGDALGRQGVDSVRLAWPQIVMWAPEILIVSPCGFKVDKAAAQTRQLLRQPGWSGLPAVRQNRVFAVDANAYFARPGPRGVDGVELLRHLIHPELCAWRGAPHAFRQVQAHCLWPLPVRVKRCPECGGNFVCGPRSDSNRCWCDELPTLRPSTVPGADCLCPACLARAVERFQISKT